MWANIKLSLLYESNDMGLEASVRPVCVSKLESKMGQIFVSGSTGSESNVLGNAPTDVLKQYSHCTNH